MLNSPLRTRIVEKRALNSDICWFTFESLDTPFTSLEPGAHVDVHLGPDLLRNYSLCAWDDSGSWLSVAVKREPEGRGGSIAMHELPLGTEVQVGNPRNNFPLVTSDQPVVFIAGGIGVTPLYAMATSLHKAGEDFNFHYFVRNRPMAAFHNDLSVLDLGDRYTLHCADIEGIPNFRDLLESYPADTNYYVCGPGPMLDSFVKACEETGRGTLYFERFGAPVTLKAPDDEDVSFEVMLNSTGEVLQIPPRKSILQVLRETGRQVEYGCSEGVCGTCITDVLDGQIDHRDHVLTNDERVDGDCMCICVSRAKSGRLTLDL